MRKLILWLALLAAASAAAKAEPAREALISDCIREARQSFDAAWRREPSLRNAIEGHRERMAAQCAAWGGARRGAVDNLLSACLAEAGGGPRYIQRGHAADVVHKFRQQEICRALAAQQSS